VCLKSGLSLNIEAVLYHYYMACAAYFGVDRWRKEQYSLRTLATTCACLLSSCTTTAVCHQHGMPIICTGVGEIRVLCGSAPSTVSVAGRGSSLLSAGVTKHARRTGSMQCKYQHARVEWTNCLVPLDASTRRTQHRPRLKGRAGTMTEWAILPFHPILMSFFLVSRAGR
jgi:hypothetical protein